MNEDPYSRLAALMKPSEERELFLRLGTVAGVSPLTLQVGGLSIGSGQLFCNASLLSEEQPAEIAIQGEAVAGSIRLTEPFKVGDTVLLCSDDDQVFYLLCKVVSV